MDYLIENVYVDTEKMLRQMHKKLLRKRVVFWAVVMMAMGLLFLFFGVALNKPSYFWWAMAYAALAAWYLTMPYRSAKKAYKNMLKYYDGNIPETVVRFGDTITFTQGNGVNPVPYNKLKQVSILKDCLLLYNEIGGAYMLANDGFTKGSMQEMFVLLKKQCPEIKLPDWQW